MMATVVCSPSWGFCECLCNGSPDKLGAALAEMVGRYGAEELSDVLCSRPCWAALDPRATEEGASRWDGVEFVEGYGYACDDVPGDFESTWLYGILSDGTLMVSHAREGHKLTLAPDDPLAAEKLGRLAGASAA